MGTILRKTLKISVSMMWEFVVRAPGHVWSQPLLNKVMEKALIILPVNLFYNIIVSRPPG